MAKAKAKAKASTRKPLDSGSEAKTKTFRAAAAHTQYTYTVTFADGVVITLKRFGFWKAQRKEAWEMATAWGAAGGHGAPVSIIEHVVNVINRPVRKPQ